LKNQELHADSVVLLGPELALSEAFISLTLERGYELCGYEGNGLKKVRARGSLAKASVGAGTRGARRAL
jgi:hypothetical protein